MCKLKVIFFKLTFESFIFGNINKQKLSDIMYRFSYDLFSFVILIFIRSGYSPSM